jgi:hypothetical protein
VGRPGTKVRSIAPATLDSARDFIAETARSVPGVEVAPANERPGSARGVIQQRNLSGYYLDSLIAEAAGGTSAASRSWCRRTPSATFAAC